MRCPAAWTDDDYHCIKPSQITSSTYTTMSACTTKHSKCEQRGLTFTAFCPESHKRVGKDLCVPVCPLGWHDEGKRCRKPADYRMAQPFLWEKGDN